METGITIRSATREDRSLVLHFHRALYVEHQARVLSPELAAYFAYRGFDEVLRADVAAMLSRADKIVLIGEREGDPVGYATGHVEKTPRRLLETKGVVEDWYVETEARGSGVGSALMARLIALFEEKGCQMVESQTWAPNEGARRAHLAMGFDEALVTYRRRCGD